MTKKFEYESECCLMDDCVHTIWSARYRLKGKETGNRKRITTLSKYPRKTDQWSLAPVEYTARAISINGPSSSKVFNSLPHIESGNQRRSNDPPGSCA